MASGSAALNAGLLEFSGILNPKGRSMDAWVQHVLAQIPADFYGTMQLQFRGGQVIKIIRSESHIPPERDLDFRKSVQGATAIRRESTAK